MAASCCIASVPIDLGRLLEGTDPTYLIWVQAVHDNAVEIWNKLNE